MKSGGIISGECCWSAVNRLTQNKRSSLVGNQTAQYELHNNDREEQ
jgi:hypothetical protein